MIQETRYNPTNSGRVGSISGQPRPTYTPTLPHPFLQTLSSHFLPCFLFFSSMACPFFSSSSWIFLSFPHFSHQTTFQFSKARSLFQWQAIFFYWPMSCINISLLWWEEFDFKLLQPLENTTPTNHAWEYMLISNTWQHFPWLLEFQFQIGWCLSHHSSSLQFQFQMLDI